MGNGDKSSRETLRDRVLWLADMLPALGDYAKEAALHLRGYAEELRTEPRPDTAFSDEAKRLARCYLDQEAGNDNTEDSYVQIADKLAREVLK